LASFSDKDLAKMRSRPNLHAHVWKQLPKMREIVAWLLVANPEDRMTAEQILTLDCIAELN
jgi:hypothetical protein